MRHPDIVGVLSVLVSPYWWRLALSDHPGDRRRFYQQIGDTGLISGTPERNAPLLEWIPHSDRRSIDDLHGEHLIEWLGT